MPQYADGAFAGGVLDKGTLDALLCGDSEEADSLALLCEVHRVSAVPRAGSRTHTCCDGARAVWILLGRRVQRPV
jgi:hypothetical protein